MGLLKIIANMQREKENNMPWKIEKADGGFYVKNLETGERMSKKPMPRSRASAQLRALYANVPEAREKEVSATPTGVPAHGPGGLFSTPGLGGGEELPKKIQVKPLRKPKVLLTKKRKEWTYKAKGNFGHKGVPGHRGGSAPRGPKASAPAKEQVTQPSQKPVSTPDQEYLMAQYQGDPWIAKNHPEAMKDYLKLLKDVHDANEYVDLYDTGDFGFDGGDGAGMAQRESNMAYHDLTRAMDRLSSFEDNLHHQHANENRPAPARAPVSAPARTVDKPEEPGILQKFGSLFKKKPAVKVEPTVSPKGQPNLYYKKMRRRKEFDRLEERVTNSLKGGEGSGYFGHAGIPGHRGGSASRSGSLPIKVESFSIPGPKGPIRDEYLKKLALINEKKREERYRIALERQKKNPRTYSETWFERVTESDANKLIKWWSAHDPRHFYRKERIYERRGATKFWDVVRVLLPEKESDNKHEDNSYNEYGEPMPDRNSRNEFGEENKEVSFKGGPGSGGFGHKGVPGRWGGAMPGSAGHVAKVPQISIVGVKRKKKRFGRSKTTPKIRDTDQEVMNVRISKEYKEARQAILETLKYGVNFRQSVSKKEKEEERGIVVYKDFNGKYRWVTFSSNAFEDRDNEIVSLKALMADVERADLTKNYGPLRWWHVSEPPLDIGDCDFNMMYGKILIESGTFRNERVGERMKAMAPNLQVSIGFHHPTSEPDSEGVFHNIRRFERSILPAGIASNLLTKFAVKGVDNMATVEEKKQVFKDIIGDEALAQSLLEAAEGTEKEALKKGMKTKEKATEVSTKGSKGNLMHRRVEEIYRQGDEEEQPATQPAAQPVLKKAPVKLQEAPVQQRIVKQPVEVESVGDDEDTLEEDDSEDMLEEDPNAEAVPAEEEAPVEEAPVEQEMPEVIGNMSIEEFAGLLADALAAALEPYLAKLKEVSDTVEVIQAKEARRSKEASGSADEVIALKSRLEKTEKALQVAARALKQTSDRLADLESDVPVGARGYVASQSEDTVVSNKERIASEQPAADPIAQFTNAFVLGQ